MSYYLNDISLVRFNNYTQIRLFSVILNKKLKKQVLLSYRIFQMRT